MIYLLWYCLVMHRPQPSLLILALASVRVWNPRRLAPFARLASISSGWVIVERNMELLLRSILQIDGHVFEILVLFLPGYFICYHFVVHQFRVDGRFAASVCHVGL